NSSNPVLPWYQLYSGDGSYCAVGEGYYYASAQNGVLFRFASNNPSTDWARVDPEGAEDYIFINPFILDRNNNKMMYLAGGSVLWRNSDLTTIEKYNSDPTSVNWTKLTNSSIATGAISTLDVSKTPANTIFYATSEGQVYRLNGANSGDPTPVNITAGSFPGGYISCVSVNPDNADEALITFANYEVISIWHTNNAGASWQNISGNLEQNPDGSGNGPSVRWAEILPTDLGTIYLVGTSTGLYSTFALNGTSTVWAQEGTTSIGNVVVDMIDSRTTDDLVVAATHGNGMYSSNVVVSLMDNPKNIVNNFKLEQNYPNPFNPTTTIDYEIPESAPVTLKIYDIQGKEIATLINSDHIAGSYSVNWNGQDRFGRPVASGTYIYQIKAGKNQESKQMVLMR
ncbi:MAG: T9SS type A sorting domain-containing protein, partial [Calditrichaceae bacterium]